MNGRKIGLLLLILAFGATVETAWNVRGDVRIGPEGCRVISGRFYGPSFTFEQADERPVGTAPRLEIRNAFGDVRVSAGAPGVVKVRLRKVVYQPTEEKARAFAERVSLRLSGEGQPLRIDTNREEIGRQDREAVGFETHLEVEAPADSVVDVRSEHGRVDLRGLASADVASSFDGVTIEEVAGDVQLESRNGDVTLRQIGGAVSLSSRHGSVEASSLAGEARLDVEHGELTVRDAASLELGQKHGGVTAERVAGDLVVRASHSEVNASDVRGRAEVETSYGGVRLERVGGAARAKAQNGSVHAEDVGGTLAAESSHGSVEAERIAGPVEIETREGHVVAKGVQQGGRIKASGGDVNATGFAGALVVELERGSAELEPRAAIAAPITVTVRHGGARLVVPAGSRVDLEAESRHGSIETEDLEGFATSRDEQERGPGRRVAGRTAEGGAVVRIQADGEIELRGAAAAAVADAPIAPPSFSAAQPTPPEATPTTSASPAGTPKAAAPAPEAKQAPPAKSAEAP